LLKFERMAFAVPEEWVNNARAADEAVLLDVTGHLPRKAQEALLKLAVGAKPERQAAQGRAMPADVFRRVTEAIQTDPTRSYAICGCGRGAAPWDRRGALSGLAGPPPKIWGIWQS
jgi:hypothetical protein